MQYQGCPLRRVGPILNRPVNHGEEHHVGGIGVNTRSWTNLSTVGETGMEGLKGQRTFAR